MMPSCKPFAPLFCTVSFALVGGLAASPPNVGMPAPDVAPSVKSLVRVDVSTPRRVTALKRALRAWDVAGTVDPGRSIDLVVTGQERRALAAAGVDAMPVIEDIKGVRAAAAAAYHSFAGFETAMSDMATAYPAITNLTSIGTSWEGRNIWCLEVSDNAGVDEGEVGVVFLGLHHAREWPGLEVALDIADRLTSQYGTDPTITGLVDSLRIWIVPCVNPDGYVWDHDLGNDWRKNRHPYAGGIGTDLNRNYDGSANGKKNGAWGTIGTGSQSHNQSTSVYVGSSPFSEPETQAVRDLILANDVTIVVSYHTYSELVLWPWGYRLGDKTDDDALLVSLGQGMAAEITRQSGAGTYTPQQSAALYPTTGVLDDWVYGFQYYQKGTNTLAFTVEIGASFQPPTSALQQILDENWDGALYMMQQASSAANQLEPVVLPPAVATPLLDTDGNFTVTWTETNPAAGADLFEVQEYQGLTRALDGAETGGGAWSLKNFSVSSARAHSGSMSYLSSPGDSKTGGLTTIDPLPVRPGDVLSFWTWFDIELDWDMAIVEVSVDGLQYDILDMFTGSSGAWVQKSYSLDAYAGKSLHIRFRYTTDASITGEGFYVDDISPMASWASITTLSSAVTDTWYDIAGRADGDYYYRVRGSNVARGFGDFGPLVMTRVQTHPADSDGDGDHDVADYAGFQLCYGGDALPVPPACANDGAVFDLDVDFDVDDVDLTTFSLCFNGPDAPPAPSCPY